MGCLIEMLFEILIEGMLELVMYIYVKIASIFIPDKQISEKTRDRIKKGVGIFAALMALSLFIGILLFLAPEGNIEHTIGAFMTVIPLVIIGIQIILGIGLLIIKAIRKRR